MTLRPQRASGVIPDLLRPAVGYLRDLIRIDTSNPPGNELAAARYLQRVFTANGIASRLFLSEPGRGNLIARLPAAPPAATRPAAGPLLVVTHLDCQPFELSGWLHHPLRGDLADGAVWGRGTVNCKGPLAVWTALLIALSRSGRSRRREIVLVAAADGVGGYAHGLEWLYQRHGAELAADAVIAQGGGWPISICGHTYYTVNCADRGHASIRLTAGPQGPDRGVEAGGAPLLLLARALALAQQVELPVHITPNFQTMVEALAVPQEGPGRSHIRCLMSPLLVDQAVDRLVTDQAVRGILLAGARNSVSPKGLRSGSTGETATGYAEAVLDCRILPGQTAATLEAELKAALWEHGVPIASPDNPDGLRIETRLETEPTGSPPAHELVEAMARAIGRKQPKAHLVPLVAPGSTSCRLPRLAGVPAYGFFPLTERAQTNGLMEANERLSLNSLEFALQVLNQVVGGYVGTPGLNPGAFASEDKPG